MRRALGSTAAAIALLIQLSAPVRGEDTKGAERFTAIAQNMSAGPGPAATRLTLRVTRWSTDEQRSALLKVLAESGSAALVEALRGQPETGNLSFTGTLGYDLRYARSFQEGETRHVVLATDRPVSGVEVLRNGRSLEKGVTILHLALNAKGEGSGTLLVGAELSLDPASGELTVEHLGTQPIQLHHVETK